MTNDELRRIAVLETHIEHLRSSIQDLTTQVKELTATLNKGRGALWIVMIVCGGAGATIATLLKKVIL